MLRIVTDVNLWISYLLTQSFRRRVERLFGQQYTLLFSDDFFREFIKTVEKPELSKRLPPDDAEQLIELLQNAGTVIEVHSLIDVCRDVNDNYLLALAKDGNADYLITRDNDLLDLKYFGNTVITTLFGFEQCCKLITLASRNGGESVAP